MAETEAQRIDRITNEILSGQRSFDDLRRSLDWLAGGSIYQPYGTATAGDDAAIAAGYDAVRARVLASFSNRGVALNQYQPFTSTSTWPNKAAGATTPPKADGTAQTPLNTAPASPAVPSEPTAPAEDPAAAELRRQAEAAEERARKDALASITAILNDYGLGELAGWVWEQLLARRSQSEVLLELRNHPVFRKRFPAIFMRQERGLSPISAEDYVKLERAYQSIARASGLPSEMFDELTDFTNLIAGDVSAEEYATRINQGWARMAQAPDEIKAAFRSYYGVGNGDVALASYFVDPDRALPLLERQAGAARVGGTGSRFGFDLKVGLAERLAAIGYDDQSSAERFGRIRRMDHLFRETVSEQRDLTAEGEGITAEFGLDDGSAERTVDARRRQRQADFGGGGGGLMGGRNTGLGSAA